MRLKPGDKSVRAEIEKVTKIIESRVKNKIFFFKIMHFCLS